MSLQTRLGALITAIGADIKALQARTPVVGTVNISFPGGGAFSNNVTKAAGLPGNRQPVHVDIQDRQIDGVVSGVIGMADSYATDGTFRARAWANTNIAAGTYAFTYVAY